MQAAASENPGVTIHASHQLTTPKTDRPWVLCIDDDVEFSNGLKLKLQSRGYDVIRAFEGLDGYRFAFEFAPVVILLDLHLPQTNGEEVLSQLRFNPETSHIPVIVVTGLNEQGLEYRMRSLGARNVFHKPISYTTLATAVDHYAAEQNEK
tara:strand:- start:168 stop:620 length:453 start_codon:yes stop_codon:yes gene_type:complete